MSDEPTRAAALPAETAVGRVTIRVDALDRVLPFYRDVIGCRVDREGSSARLSAADGRELIVFEEEPDAAPRPRSAAGLYHAAIRLPDRASLANALERIRATDTRLDGASDHLVSEALYLRDPAGNGLELYCDRPRDEWTRLPDGRVEMDTLRLDLADLTAAGHGAEATGRGRPASPDGGTLPPGTDVGHVHLEVTDLARSTDFYVDGLGLRPSAQDAEGVAFLAAGDYHHHVAVNVWQRRRDALGRHQGLVRFELVLPDEGTRTATLSRLADRGHDTAARDGVPTVTDPDGILVDLAVRDATARP